MKMNIKATGIELTPEILSYAEKRLSKVRKYLADASDPVMAVELGRNTNHHKQGEVFRAEVRIAGGGADFYASRETSDLYRAIDEVKDEIVREVTRVKGKRRHLLRHGGRVIKDMMRGFSSRFKFRKKF
ncbi:ribosome-associated translation inhibitor RaiA [Candidatus Parcubacteria bacterium]|nr:ribosome-associated translation inhibitor RaiA [Candidatus Parcubacteria bacterium]